MNYQEVHYQDLIASIFLHPRPWILSGAGISTESGIADFRGPGGLWERIDPMAYFSVEALHNNPRGFYSLGIDMFDFMEKAHPNQAHLVLGEFQQKRIIGPIVTQNIDSLHQKGGARYVYEVHGHVRTATCLNCRRTVVTLKELSQMVQDGYVPPRCGCGGLLKPDVILFGDSMPADYSNALSMLNVFKGFELAVIVVGSTLTVSPINMFPLQFKEMCIINQGSTMLDSQAHFRFEGQAGETMNELKRQVIAINGGRDIDILPPGFLPGLLINCLDSSRREMDRAHSRGASGHDRRCLADALLVKKMLAAYPRRSERQPLEEHWLRLAEHSADELEASCPGGIKPLWPGDGGHSYILTGLADYARVSVHAAGKYLRQPRCDEQVGREMLLQALGAAGLLRFAVQNAGLQDDTQGVTMLKDKISSMTADENIDIEIEPALDDI